MIGGAGEVLAASSECGDPVLLSAVLPSVRRWRFEPPEPDKTWGNTATTTLTFQWRDHSAALIWERKDYPIRDDDAKQLVRAVPKVARELKEDPHLILEIDLYPEERDGVFYLFHLYANGDFMTFTLGWYEVNAYTGEIWDALQFQAVRGRALRRLQKAIRQRVGSSARFEGLNPWSTKADKMRSDPCADRPR